MSKEHEMSEQSLSGLQLLESLLAKAGTRSNEPREDSVESMPPALQEFIRQARLMSGTPRDDNGDSC